MSQIVETIITILLVVVAGIIAFFTAWENLINKPNKDYYERNQE